jgi:hypothetical protein
VGCDTCFGGELKTARTTVKNHETLVVMESRAPKRTPRVVLPLQPREKYLGLFNNEGSL